jgi:hypothetical protein
MAQPKAQKPKQPESKVPTDPGFEKRLGEMYKKVLHTPPPRKQGEPAPGRPKRAKR